MHGTWPTWCTGVRTAPFVTHAWVEVNGTPVGEPFPAGYYQRHCVARWQVRRYWQLNPTGSQVLRWLLDGFTKEQAATRLAEEYSTTLERSTVDSR